MPDLQSWGRYPRAQHRIQSLFWRRENPFRDGRGPYLAYGLGRSYGDACLNDGGTLVPTSRLDRFIAFDRDEGLLTCESGISLGAILDLVVPHGWFLPVVPGTKHVTVGGAIANDVHGKNHHRAGTFGMHVQEMEVLRSSGERIVCSPAARPELFQATVAGLGLTGIILTATIRLRRITSEQIVSETVPVRDLSEFMDVARASDATHEYTVAWVDCLATGKGLGRGVLYRGLHAEGTGTPRLPRRGFRVPVPFELPISPLNRVTLGAFNVAYYTKNRLRTRRRLVPYDSFFFPLDGLDRWNRIYGKNGLLQFQCVLPPDASAVIREMLTAIARVGEGSFLAVLKNFGAARSPGLLSFPRPGITLALDFANKGDRTAGLFRELYTMVKDCGGAIYPAKDAHMPPALFRAQNRDRLAAFRAQADPACSSSLWRRVNSDV